VWRKQQRNRADSGEADDHVTAGTYSATAHFSHFLNFTTTTSGQLTIKTWGNSADTLWVDFSASCTVISTLLVLAN
jgi:hypothetical protein